jgi:transposase
MLRPMPIEPIPPETGQVARAAFPKGNRYLRVADALDSLLTDEAFLALFPTHGQPALPPWRLALVTILPFAEGRPDRQAAHAARSRIDWKYVLRLELTDPGFDASVLSEFRTRLIAGAAEDLLFETLLTWCHHRQLVKARGRQRTDSTHLLAAVRALNRIEVVSETMRHALNTLAVVAPEWLRAASHPDWRDRYMRRAEDDRLPTTLAARTALALTIEHDGWRLLAAIDHPDAPLWLREVPAVAILRRVWIQNYWWDGTQFQWREADNIPPAARFISSPDDSEAHDARKHTTQWVGYKVHPTETCEDDLPHLITNIATTPGPAADGAVTPQSTPRCSNEAPCPALISWTPASWTQHSWSRVKPTTTWISWGPRASTITGKPAQGPVLTRSISRSMGITNTRLVRRARAVSAGRQPSITASIPS